MRDEVEVSVEEMIIACETAARVPEDRGGTAYTAWERNFITAIRLQFRDRAKLTERQVVTLRRLYDKS